MNAIEFICLMIGVIAALSEAWPIALICLIIGACSR